MRCRSWTRLESEIYRKSIGWHGFIHVHDVDRFLLCNDIDAVLRHFWDKENDQTKLGILVCSEKGRETLNLALHEK